jgi:protein-L-isoaspartate(D-aspartate) O-methyltransferase
MLIFGESNDNRQHKLREQMVKNHLIRRGITDKAVLEAFRRVPLHHFVSPELEHAAYDDRALPTESGQTISQPYIVALMTQHLQLSSTHNVLEVGTGSGYHTAILAEIVRHVYSVERLQTLQKDAARKLKDLGYKKISLTQGDGTLGWPQHAPYDRITVAAAAPDAPQPLLRQLASGGKMIIPIGGTHSQELILITRTETGLEYTTLCGCVFVKLTGQAAWPPEQ